MKTTAQSSKKASRLIQVRPKVRRSLSIEDNRPDASAQTQLFEAVRSREASPLASLVGQGRAGFSQAMMQKKGVAQLQGVVQRGGGEEVIEIDCGEDEVLVEFNRWVLELGQTMLGLIIDDIHVEITRKDYGHVVTLTLKSPKLPNPELLNKVKKHLLGVKNNLAKKIPAVKSAEFKLPEKEELKSEPVPSFEDKRDLSGMVKESGATIVEMKLDRNISYLLDLMLETQKGTIDQNIHIENREITEQGITIHLALNGISPSDATHLFMNYVEGFFRYVKDKTPEFVEQQLKNDLKRTDKRFSDLKDQFASRVAKEEKREPVLDIFPRTYMLKEEPSDEIVSLDCLPKKREGEITEEVYFCDWAVRCLSTQAIQYKDQIIIKNTNFTADGLIAEYLMHLAGESTVNRSMLDGLSEEQTSSLYFVGQGLFAVGTGRDFPGGFFTDGAGPCVAIVIRCEKGIFALGHFDSDVNGGTEARASYNKPQVEHVISLLYRLMIAKNGNSKDLGHVEVVLTKGEPWRREQFAIYHDSIIKYFGKVTIRRANLIGAYANEHVVAGIDSNVNVYLKSLERKSPKNVLEFINNLYPESIPLGADGLKSLEALKQDFKLLLESGQIDNRRDAIAKMPKSVESQKKNVERIKETSEKINSLRIQAREELGKCKSDLKLNQEELAKLEKEKEKVKHKFELSQKDNQKQLKAIETKVKDLRRIAGKHNELIDTFWTMVFLKSSNANLKQIIEDLKKIASESPQKTVKDKIANFLKIIQESGQILQNQIDTLTLIDGLEEQYRGISKNISELLIKIRGLEIIVDAGQGIVLSQPKPVDLLPNQDSEKFGK